LSQLEFDTKAIQAANKVSKEQALLLKEMKKTSVVRSSLKAASRVVSKSFLTEDDEPGEESHYIIPKLSGPKADLKNSSSITSAASWKAGPRGCADVKTANEQVSKAVALEELLFRFTGDASFSEFHCSDVCTSQNEVAYVSKLKIKSKLPENGTFSFHMKRGQCHYQMTKADSQKWQMVEASGISCSCFVK